MNSDNEDENSIISNSELNDDIYDKIAENYDQYQSLKKKKYNDKNKQFDMDEWDGENVIGRIQYLEEKLKQKESLLKKLKEVMEKDDQVKDDLRNKISELRDNINTMKDRLSTQNDFDDDDLEEMLNRMDHREEYDERNDPNLPGSTQYQMNINNAQGMLGNAMLNDYQVRIYLKNSKTCWGKFKIFLDKITNFFVPFKSDMKLIFARFDRNISGIFQFFRFLYIFNIFVFLASSYLLIYHLLNYDSTNDQTICKTFLPCRILYSRFTSNEKNIYSFTFMTICIVMFIGVISNWTEYKRHDLLLKLFDSESIHFSKEVFNPWNWSAISQDTQDDNKQRLKNICTIGVKESEIKYLIKNRSGGAKCLLIMRRIFSLILSAIILIIDAGCVAGLYVLQAYFTFRDTDKAANSALDYVALVIPSIGILILNAIVPILLEVLINLEKWDFNSTKIVQSIWRNYIAKLFTSAVVYVLVILFIILEKTSQEILGENSFDFGLSLSCSYNVIKIDSEEKLKSTPNLILRSYSNYANCKEDEAASILFINLIIDWISRKLIPPVILLMRFLICKKCRNKKTYKAPYNDIAAVSSILLFSVQIYMLIPIFPYILLISPLLLFIDFKCEVMMLKYFYDKPEKLTLQEKSGYFIMTLFTFSMIAIIIVFILYFVNATSHHGYMKCYTDATGLVYEYYNATQNCGPFIDLEKPKNTLYDSIASSPWIFTIYEFLANPLYILIFAFLLVIIITYSFKVSNAFQFYIKEKKTETKIVERSLNEVIKKLRDQIRFYKKGVKNI